MKHEKRNMQADTQDYEQNLVNMQVDLCLIRLVQQFGNQVHNFDQDAQDTAIDRSLDFMQDYIYNFESYVKYLQSQDYILERYTKITGSVPVRPIEEQLIQRIRYNA